jgi:hypothetical protein
MNPTKSDIMNLQLSLKTKWFEMTKSGIKTEDYREITPYWAKRLLCYQDGELSASLTDETINEMCSDFNKCDGIECFEGESDIDFQIDNWYLSFKHFKTNTMTLGYPKSTDKERIIKFEHAGIEIRTGNPEWGAEPNKLYFVIKHGKRIQ